jgi:hypothetical protein
MKNTLLVLSAACALTGCAGVRVSHVDTATGATKPKAIYIRSYADEAVFVGNHDGGHGEQAIRHSLAPAEYSQALKEELEKIAPSMVLANNEVPKTGWLVESNLELIDAGTPLWRGLNGPIGPGLGSSRVKIHVRVTDASRAGHHHNDSKDVSKGAANGNVIYEFDLVGGSRGQGGSGSLYAPGFGYATPFDYKNAAERVSMALSTDPERYGARTSPVIQ